MADYLEQLVKRGVISNKAAARMMTHQAEQPNPAQPIVDAVRGYLQSGDYNPVHNPGTQPADYLRELHRNPDILAKNIEQASQFNFGGIMKRLKGGGARMGPPESEDLRPAANLNISPLQKSINKYSDALIYNKITPQEFEGFMEALGLDKSSIPELSQGVQRQGDALRQAVREELMGMRDEGSLRGPDERAKDTRSQFRIVPKEK